MADLSAELKKGDSWTKLEGVNEAIIFYCDNVYCRNIESKGCADMNTMELCKYIKHYLEHDKTQSAIMIDGEWGTGKSYFIEHDLVPFLKEKTTYQSVVISLYGLKDVSEISKSIYFDLRIKHLTGNSEAARTGAVIANTITKGISSLLGVDLNMNGEKLQELYESVNMKDKVLILEDLERTEISLFALMGYVNNMVEHDKTKVLLVANESAIIKTENVEYENEKGKQLIAVYTQETQNYLKIKEKTVGDTLRFNCDLETAIRSIVTSYGDALNMFNNAQSIQDIVGIMQIHQCYNLRTFRFACQKTADILEYLDDDVYTDEFKKAIFYGIIAFSFRWKSDNHIKWRGDENISIDLGLANHPLFRFCYDYIKDQRIDETKIPLAQAAFQHMRRFDMSKSMYDPDILTIHNYHIKKEQEIRDAIKSIEKRLLDPDDISYYEYNNLIVRLLEIRSILGISIDTIKERIIENVRGKARDLNLNQLFPVRVDHKNKEFEKIKSQMILSMNEMDEEFFGWGYIPENVKNVYNYLLENRTLFYNRGEFIVDWDPEKFAQMFLQSNAEQMDDIRAILHIAYPVEDMSEPSDEECGVLVAIKTKLQKGQSNAKLDKIQQMHYNWFIEHLSKVVEKNRDFKIDICEN